MPILNKTKKPSAKKIQRQIDDFFQDIKILADAAVRQQAAKANYADLADSKPLPLTPDETSALERVVEKLKTLQTSAQPVEPKIELTFEFYPWLKNMLTDLTAPKDTTTKKVDWIEAITNFYIPQVAKEDDFKINYKINSNVSELWKNAGQWLAQEEQRAKISQKMPLVSLDAAKKAQKEEESVTPEFAQTCAELLEGLEEVDQTSTCISVYRTLDLWNRTNNLHLLENEVDRKACAQIMAIFTTKNSALDKDSIKDRADREKTSLAKLTIGTGTAQESALKSLRTLLYNIVNHQAFKISKKASFSGSEPIVAIEDKPKPTRPTRPSKS